MSTISDKSIAETIKENGYKLLGQVSVTENDYARLIEYARSKVRYLFLASIPRADLMLSVTLVQIAIRHYQDGKYWKCFQDELNMELPSSQLNYIGQIFAKTIRYYGLFELKREDNSSQMYVENIKAHAFVTDYYMHGFFDFAYSFFENSLFRELSDDLSEDIEALATFMSSTLSNSKDAFSADGSGKKAAKSYKLLKSTRAVFAQASLQTVYSYFYPVLELIEKYYYDDAVPSVPQGRFETKFVEWCQNKESAEHFNQRKGANERRVISHKPYIKMDINGGFGFLVIPPQKFRNNEWDGTAYVSVTINGYSEKRNLELYKSFGIYISEEISIPIPDIFDEIEISIVSMSDKRFKFPKSSYRIFNSEWENVFKFSKGHNYLLAKHGIAIHWENEQDILDYTDEYKDWLYYSVIISDESLCYVGNKPISTIGEFSYEPVFDTVLEHFELISSTDKKLIATREHPGISFVLSKKKINGTILLINGIKYPVKNIKEKTAYDWPDDMNKTAVNIALENILPNTDQRYQVFLDVPGENTRKVCEYVLLRQFNCRLDKPKYIYSKEGYLSIKKAGHTVSFDEPTWAVDYENDGNVLYSFPITDNTTYVEFNLELNDEMLLVRIPVYVFKYGFSPNTMTCKKVDFIWYADLGESLYIYLPDAKDMFAYRGRNKASRCIAEEMEGNVFRIDISELIRTIKQEYKYCWQYINLEYIDGKVRQIPLPPILRNVVVDPYFKLSAEGNEVFMDVSLIGKADLRLTVKDYRSGETVIENRQINLGRNNFPELTASGFYNLFPSMEEADEFGFDVESTPLKPRIGVGCMDINNLVNCRLQIKDILVDEDSLSLSYRYLVHTFEKVGEDEYTGGFFRVEIKDGREDWLTRRLFGSAKIKVYQKDEELKFSLTMYSKDQEDWIPPYFDRQRNIILGCDNRLIYTAKDYSRFIPLEEDYTEYIVDLSKLRRIK